MATYNYPICGGGGATSAINYNVTTYLSPFGDTPSAPEIQVQLKVKGSFTAQNLWVYVTQNSIATTNITFASRKGAGAGGQSISITHGATGAFQDDSGTDTLADTNLFNYQVVTPNTSGTITFGGYSVLWSGTGTGCNVGASNGAGVSLARASTGYCQLLGELATPTTTRANFEWKTQSGAAVTYFRLYASAFISSRVCTVYNNGSAGNNTVTVNATGAFEDTTPHTDTVTTGHTVCWFMAAGASGSGNTTITTASALWTASTSDGTYPLVSSGGAKALSNSTLYFPMSGNITGNATLANGQSRFGNLTGGGTLGTLKNLQCYTSTYSNAATITVQDTTNPTGLTVTTAATTTWYLDSTHVFVPSTNNLLTFKSVGSSATSTSVTCIGCEYLPAQVIFAIGSASQTLTGSPLTLNYDYTPGGASLALTGSALTDQRVYPPLAASLTLTGSPLTLNYDYTPAGASQTLTGSNLPVQYAYPPTDTSLSLTGSALTYSTAAGTKTPLCSCSGLSVDSGMGEYPRYFPIVGSQSSNTHAFGVCCVMPTSGTIDTFYFASSVAPGAGTSLTVTLYKNGSPTAATATISDTATNANDLTHSISVVAGDILYYYLTKSGSPAACFMSCGAVFTSATAGESIILGCGGYALDGSDLFTLVSGPNSSGTVESPYLTPCPTNGTLKNLYTYCPNGTGLGGSSAVYLRKAGANTALTASILITTGSQASDTTHSVSVSAGDLLDMIQSNPSTGNGDAGPVSWGMVFVPTIAGESAHFSSTLATASWSFTPTDGTQNQQNKSLNAVTCTAKNLYVRTDTAVTNTVALEVNGSNSSLSVSLVSTTAGNDTTHTPSLAVGDVLELYCPGIDSVYQNIGFVLYTGSGGIAYIYTPGAGSLSLTGSNLTVQYVTPPLAGSLSLAGSALAYSVNYNYTPTDAALSLTGSSLTIQRVYPPTAASLTLTGSPLTLNYDYTPSTGFLTLTGSALTVNYSYPPAAGSLTLTGSNLTYSVVTAYPIGAASLSLTASDLTVGWDYTPSGGSLSLTGSSLTVQYVYTPSAASLSLTGSALGISFGSFYTPSAASLSLTGSALTPNYSYPPAAASMSLTGSSLGFSIQSVFDIGPASLTLTGSALSYNISFAFGAASLSLTASLLTVQYVYSPSSASLTLTGSALTYLATIAYTPGAASLSLIASPLTLNYGLNPGPATLLLTGASLGDAIVTFWPLSTCLYTREAIPVLNTRLSNNNLYSRDATDTFQAAQEALRCPHGK